MAGRVEGAQFFRNGIATARNQRRLTYGAQKALSNFLNPKSGTTKEVAKSVEEISKALVKAGSTREAELIGPEILDFTKFTRKNLKEKVSLLLARTPQNKEIKLNVYAAIDFAFSLRKKADYTALVVIGVDHQGNFYILDIDRFKTDRIIE